MRVIPRDAFNQANLLENIGRLYIELEKLGKQDLLVDEEEYEDSFEMIVNEWDDAQYIKGVYVKIDNNYEFIKRSINSRERYSIYLTNEDESETWIFNEDGTLIEEFLNLIK